MGQQPDFILIAESIRSLHNVGALFRTADGLGITKIFLCGYSAQPPRPEIAKVSLGAEQHVSWEFTPDVLAVLAMIKRSGVTVAALEQTSRSVEIEAWQPVWPLALIVGNEVEGVTQPALDAADVHLAIRMDGTKESLNVSVAAGIALASLRVRRPPALSSIRG